MVNDEGQLYTIEGFIAAAIMLTTAYLILGTATSFIPGDEHISEMQLEQMGSDALAMMDIPDTRTADAGTLELCIRENRPDWFRSNFTDYMRTATGATGATVSHTDDIRYNATIYYRNNSGGVGSYFFAESDRGELICREPAVRTTRWVYLPGGTPYENRPQEVLIEVMLWRG